MFVCSRHTKIKQEPHTEHKNVLPHTSNHTEAILNHTEQNDKHRVITHKEGRMMLSSSLRIKQHRLSVPERLVGATFCHTSIWVRYQTQEQRCILGQNVRNLWRKQLFQDVIQHGSLTLRCFAGFSNHTVEIRWNKVLVNSNNHHIAHVTRW